MKILRSFIPLFFLSLEIFSQTPVDTIIVTDTINKGYYPQRSELIPKLATARFVDSIRVDGKYIINEGNKKYYLIVKDKKGNKRLEGNFFDQFADGHVIEYDAKGMVLAEGDYRIKKLKKPWMIRKVNGYTYKKNILSEKDGTWKYYNSKGKLIREDTYLNFELTSTKKY